MRVKIKIAFVFLLFAAHVSVAQIMRFQHVYSGSGYDFAYSVTQTSDKGYAVAGATSSTGNGSSDVYLLKTDSLGVLLWQKTYGGINIDQAYSIKETKDTGLVLAGFTNSFGNGGYDLYIIKTDRNGDTIWTKTYGGTDWDFAYSIAQTTDGGYIVAGGTFSYGAGYEDMYLLKLNALGDSLWTKTYGGAETDEAKSVIQTKEGGYILTGFSKSLGDEKGDFYTVKTNSGGDTLWTNRYDGTDEDIAYEVIERVFGGYIVGGKSMNMNGDFDGYAMNVSVAGKTTGGSPYGAGSDDAIHSIKQSPGGRWAMAGYTYSFGAGVSDFLLYVETLTGPRGNTFGETNKEVAYYLNNTKDNGYIICGNTTSYGNKDHIFLVKTDSNGVSAAPIDETIITRIEAINKPNAIFTIYPNPANETLFLSFINKNMSASNLITICITDVLGREYYRKTDAQYSLQAIELNTVNLENGIYIVTVTSENYSVNQKLIIER